ncbi:MAG: TM2 domain-containing protein [Spirochaetaceae bacterium]|jgi:TM2 domain-containing membrane protein YozV|nr:TM2 domain-containing protein [Spirochaetaceae bacterium]
MYSTFLAYFLWFCSFFGIAGFHRFYLGKIGTGLLWLCTGGLFGFGAIYDFFTLGRQVKEANYRAALSQPGYSRRTAPQGWRDAEDTDFRVIPAKKENPERIVLRTAKNNRGIITPGDLALEADIPMEEAKKLLDGMVAQGFAELRVRQTGTVVYVIPEFTDSSSPLEDL